jgi:hypothetical protein
MANFDYPSNAQVVTADGMVTPVWNTAFSRWHNLIIAGSQSGTTAQRPVSFLYVGRRYYDETLSKPIYFSALPNVWRDAMGNIV